MKVYLTAFIKAKPDTISALKESLQALVVASKQEAACIQYDLHQGTEDPAIFIFHEIWESQDGLDLHNMQPYIQQFPSALVDGGVAIYKTQLV